MLAHQVSVYFAAEHNPYNYATRVLCIVYPNVRRASGNQMLRAIVLAVVVVAAVANQQIGNEQLLSLAKVST